MRALMMQKSCAVGMHNAIVITLRLKRVKIKIDLKCLHCRMHMCPLNHYINYLQYTHSSVFHSNHRNTLYMYIVSRYTVMICRACFFLFCFILFFTRASLMGCYYHFQTTCILTNYVYYRSSDRV